MRELLDTDFVIVQLVELPVHITFSDIDLT